MQALQDGTSLSLSCKDGHFNEFKFELYAADPLAQIQFYLQNELVGTRKVQGYPNNIKMLPGETGATLALNAAPYEGQSAFQWYSLYTLNSKAGEVHSTVDADTPKWSKASFNCTGVTSTTEDLMVHAPPQMKQILLFSTILGSTALCMVLCLVFCIKSCVTKMHNSRRHKYDKVVQDRMEGDEFVVRLPKTTTSTAGIKTARKHSMTQDFLNKLYRVSPVEEEDEDEVLSVMDDVVF
jgi:hypothetical protein